jgi:hypothetical protein
VGTEALATRRQWQHCFGNYSNVGGFPSNVGTPREGITNREGKVSHLSFEDLVLRGVRSAGVALVDLSL